MADSIPIAKAMGVKVVLLPFFGKGALTTAAEMDWLGKDRICEVHLKDNPHFLGEGKIDFPAVVATVSDIGFAEWAEVETDCPAKDVPADMTRNLKYIRGLTSARG